MTKKSGLFIVTIALVVVAVLWSLRAPKKTVQVSEEPAAAVVAQGTPEPSLAPGATSAQANPVASATPAQGGPAAQPVDKSQQTERAKFQALTTEVWRTLPTKKQLQSLKEADVHNTPKELLEAGDQLGRVAEALKANPNLSNDAIQFYGACALEGQFANAIRALCLNNLDQQLASKGKTLGAFPGIEKVPESIRDLSQKLDEHF